MMNYVDNPIIIYILWYTYVYNIIYHICYVLWHIVYVNILLYHSYCNIQL